MKYKHVAVIVDIVRSRTAPDRAALQRGIELSFDEANRERQVRDPLWPTVGDEFQIVYETLDDALRGTLLARLLAPAGLDFRVGLGRGELREVDRPANGRPIQDGSAWWSARDAIEEAHRRESSGSPYVRSWFAAADEAAETIALVNSYLLLRDQLVSRMPDRARRLAAGALQGRTQLELAGAEGISQSAVSQSLQRSGAAALLSAQELSDGLAAG